MRKVLFAVVLSFVFKVGFSHDYNLLSFGVNTPVKYHAKVSERNLGIEFGYSRGYMINERLSFEGGVAIDVWGRSNREVQYYNGGALQGVTYSYFNFNFDIPFMVNYKYGQWGFKSGLAVSSRNLIWISKTDVGGEGGRYVFNEGYHGYGDDLHRSFGVDFRCAASYSLTTKIDLYANFRTPIVGLSADYMGFQKKQYGLISVGVCYRFPGK